MLSILHNNIRKKPYSDIYCVTEASYYYEFDQSLMDKFLEFNKSYGGLIADWYRSLTDDEKCGVIKRPRFSEC
jgi:hypothetical protein